ncbi:MAG: hypothetical protein AAF231_09365 [Pseudomonadota bacterium]
MPQTHVLANAALILSDEIVGGAVELEHGEIHASATTSPRSDVDPHIAELGKQRTANGERQGQATVKAAARPGAVLARHDDTTAAAACLWRPRSMRSGGGWPGDMLPWLNARW